jgi:hypothetical protein
MAGAFLCSSPLLANSDEQGEQTHVPIGTRMMSKVEHAAIQEGRARQVEERLNEEGQPASGEQLANEKGDFDPSAENEDEFSPRALPYKTTHQGVYQFPVAVSLLGDTVELTDGSIWSVRSKDRYKSLNWLTSDTIVITANHEWFSVYDYKLVNQNTGKSLAVNMMLGPYYNGSQTHWIIALDYDNKKLILEDGSLWYVSGWDKSVLSSWAVNDTVIIGINNGWWSGSRPNILINVNTINYCRAKCN